LVAEQVEKVNPDLVVRDEEGKLMTVRYEAVNAMLLNEFLKEHREVKEEVRRNKQQEKTISELKSVLVQQKNAADETAARQKKEIELLRTTLKAQAEQIQKVSDQLALSKPARRLVVNNP